MGWCAVEHRENYPVLNGSRILKKLDDAPVWSITCFFIEKQYRNKGMTVQILNSVKNYVKNRGGELLEGYPIEPKKNIFHPLLHGLGSCLPLKMQDSLNVLVELKPVRL